MQKHTVCLFYPMHNINQNHDELSIWLWSIFQIILNQASPLHDLMFRSIWSIAITWSINKKSLIWKLYLQKCQLFCFARLFACLHKICSHQWIYKWTLPYITSPKEDKLLKNLLMRNEIPNIIKVANCMNIFYCNLLMWTGIDYVASKKREKFLLCSVNVYCLLWNIDHTSLENLFHLTLINMEIKLNNENNGYDMIFLWGFMKELKY